MSAPLPAARCASWQRTVGGIGRRATLGKFCHYRKYPPIKITCGRTLAPCPAHRASLDPAHPLHRTHRLRTYRRCFPGSAGVRWLIQEGHAASEEQATTLGNAMLQAGLLHHVAYEHTFKDADILYK